MQPGNPPQDPYQPEPSHGQHPQYGEQPPSYGQPSGYGEQPPQYGQPQYADPYAQPSSGAPGQPYPAAPDHPGPGTYGTPAGQPSNTMGLIAMILGIVSIPVVCFVIAPTFLLGIPLGITAAVLGYLSMKRADRGLATNHGQALTGLICGTISTALGVLVIILASQ